MQGEDVWKVGVAAGAALILAIAFMFTRPQGPSAEEVAGASIRELHHTMPLAKGPYARGYEEPTNRYATHHLEYGGKTYSYHTYPQTDPSPKRPKPLIVLLHGSGRSGVSMIDMWRRLANEEDVVLVALNSGNGGGWPQDQEIASLIAQMPEIAQLYFNVDTSRSYLFGHSSGANMAMYTLLQQPDVFAALAVHAGALNPQKMIVNQKNAKPPVLLMVGDKDELFPVEAVRRTAKTFAYLGFSSAFYVFSPHGHWYYANADVINQKALSFFRKFHL